MKKKIIGILVCMLLIATALPAVGMIDTGIRPHKLSETKQGVLDQSQERDDECKWFSDAWQEFLPVGKKLLHVEVKIKQGYEGSPDLILSIEKPLGTPLVSLNMKATDIPDICDWVTFDIDDIEMTPGDTYCIHLKCAPGGEYAWCGANGDPYPAGDSDLGAQWDWCFKTYVDKSKSKAIHDDESEWSTSEVIMPVSQEPTGLFGWVWLRGLVFNPRESGSSISALAINLHYIEITPMGVNKGVVRLKKVSFRNGIFIKMSERGLFGYTVYVSGFCHGGIDIQ